MISINKETNSRLSPGLGGVAVGSPGEISISNLSPPLLPVYLQNVHCLESVYFLPPLVSEAQLKGKDMINGVWVKCKISHFFTQVKPHGRTSSVLYEVRVWNGEEPSSGKEHDLQDFRHGLERCTSPAQLRCVTFWMSRHNTRRISISTFFKPLYFRSAIKTNYIVS